MSTCFQSSSILKPFPHFPQFNSNRFNANLTPFIFTQKNYKNNAKTETCYRRSVRVLEHGTGVLDDQTEVEDEKGLFVTGDGAVEDDAPVNFPTKRFSKKRVDYDDEVVDDDNRFKLRNGREVFEEKAYLVGVARKDDTSELFSIEESLKELAQLADTAGLMVIDSTYQKLSTPNPRTYIGSGKVAEIKTAINGYGVETVIFDDELSPGQLRNLEKAFGGNVRVCDRTALILDIFDQRAATREAALQLYVALSRGISRKTTKVLVKPVKKFVQGGIYTSNVVYQEVLRDD